MRATERLPYRFGIHAIALLAVAVLVVLPVPSGLLAAGLFGPSQAWAEDVPTSIARAATPDAWTTPPAQSLGGPDGMTRAPAPMFAPMFAPTAAIPAAAPRITRRAARPYDITTGAYRPRGPVEVRDEWLLAQPKLTLPATSPDPMRPGAWRLHFYINRGNDFGFDQSGPAEMPTDRRFLVDGEHQTTAVDVEYGLSRRFSVGARLPIHWRGGGFMDEIIDWFHDLTSDIGFLDNGRPAFLKDQYRVEGRDAAFNQYDWNHEDGTGLGRLEVNATWNVLVPCRRCDWRAAVITRVTLPTGTGPFDNGGVDVGLQAIVGKQIARRWDVYAGVGGTWFSETEIRGFQYEDFRGWGFVAAEWHVGHNISLVAEFDVASRLITNIVAYPELSSYLNISCRWDLSRCFEVEFGFTENIEAQQGTIDFGVFGGFSWQF